MKYMLGIRIGGFEHPPFSYDTCDEALQAAEDAIEAKVFRRNEESGNIAIQLGLGTIIKIMSEYAITEERRENEKTRRNPLLGVGDTDAPWKLVVQLGAIQLPPLDMASEEAADRAVENAIETGVFRHVLKPSHDYLFIQTGPGTVYMGLPTEQYVKQRRSAIEAAMRQAAAQAPRGATQGGNRIVMPPGSNRGN